MKIKSISMVIFEAMAKSLDLEENCLSKQFTEEHEVMSARFLLYPPCPTPDQVLGLKAHSDKSGITFLLQVLPRILITNNEYHNERINVN
ncbi:putative codeine 3-O-demethylase [Helianthus annuus]|uniref:Codeine 3-O-demethylase n=1 Tax=Helianthus annuus TaxID=4232 RepID=A0A9K3I0V9_HELAN|nr:putative codeine 3-O-demethylase [Helianthus annuus]KAJ0515292.1 putative codeine 3-O-demethylase [Helianthus annuus]KAJ0523758.1 putative codeine 3-O-demethylase [Helianthus annuus]KAJ0531487.1 putative codeine 3-O-demethylase [Helianthus annuus]KAJ0698327.1 putative codeine 3-O-demethylase [Helianthus annuus]